MDVGNGTIGNVVKAAKPILNWDVRDMVLLMGKHKVLVMCWLQGSFKVKVKGGFIMGMVQDRFNGMIVDIRRFVKGMFIGMVGRKYQTNMSVVLCVLVIMESTGLVQDMKGSRLRHLLMEEILDFIIWC